MPIYEYQCKKNGHRFEQIQKFSDPPVKKCPECGSPVEQVITAPAVQFKGTGWYVTDYAKKSGTSGSSSSSSESSSGDTKSESKSESSSSDSKDSSSKKDDKPKSAKKPEKK